MEINIVFIRIAAIMMALAVILGAFGAHALKNVLEPEQLQSYQTGIQYHFLHAIGLFIIAFLAPKNPVLFSWAGNLMFIGIICFSGSIYLLSCKTILGIESMRWIGPITPIGGMLFIISWLLVFYSTFKFH